jgi:hypothetical protein
MKVLDGIPYIALAAVAVLMALAPFGQSHLVEKTRMLFAGTLRKPLDWFDLVMHSTPILLLLVKVAADLARRAR